MKTLGTVLSKPHEFLHGFSPHHAGIVLSGASEVKFDADEIIFRQGEPAGSLFLIESGKVTLETRTAGGESIAFQELSDGDAFGWSWLFPGFAWHFQARALQPTQVICCDGAHMLVQANEDHEFGYELIKRVGQIVIGRLQALRTKLIANYPSQCTQETGAIRPLRLSRPKASVSLERKP